MELVKSIKLIEQALNNVYLLGADKVKVEGIKTLVDTPSVEMCSNSVMLSHLQMQLIKIAVLDNWPPNEPQPTSWYNLFTQRAQFVN